MRMFNIIQNICITITNTTREWKKCTGSEFVLQFIRRWNLKRTLNFHDNRFVVSWNRFQPGAATSTIYPWTWDISFEYLRHIQPGTYPLDNCTTCYHTAAWYQIYPYVYLWIDFMAVWGRRTRETPIQSPMH